MILRLWPGALRELKKLDNKKAPTHDKTWPPLSEVPEVWKFAFLLKGGNPSEGNNYRPICPCKNSWKISQWPIKVAFRFKLFEKNYNQSLEKHSIVTVALKFYVIFF